MVTRNPLINNKITTLRESATLAINQKVKTLRAKGKTIYHFGFGQSPFPVAKEIQMALIANSHQKAYLPTLGLRELRQAFCTYYAANFGYQFSPEYVAVGPGSKELIFQILFILEGPLIIPAPSWVSYGPQAQIAGKSIYAVQTKIENGYKISGEELADACKQLKDYRQKLLIINSPNNPTGSVYSDRELEDISRVCKNHGVIVISDEIYNLINFTAEKSSFSKHYPEGTIVANGLSKGYSAGGYRLGFLAVPDNFRSVISALSAMISETYSAVSSPTQYAAIEAYLDNPGLKNYVSQCRKIHHAVGSYCYSRLGLMGLTLPEPHGAFYLFPGFEKFGRKLRQNGIHNAEELCHLLLEKASVATLPASDFYCPPDMLACRVATVDYDGEAVYNASINQVALDDQFVIANCPAIESGLNALEMFLKAL